MFSKTQNNSPQTPPAPAPRPEAAPPLPEAPRGGQKLTSLIASDMKVEGDISGGGEIQIDGVIKGDIRVEKVTVGEGGQVEGGIFGDAVEVRGKVSGSITAKQVRLYGACQVDGDITHEQLAMETGAFFQGRSLRLQRPAAEAAASPGPRAGAAESAARKEAAFPPAGNGQGLTPKPSPAP